MGGRTYSKKQGVTDKVLVVAAVEVHSLKKTRRNGKRKLYAGRFDRFYIAGELSVFLSTLRKSIQSSFADKLAMNKDAGADPLCPPTAEKNISHNLEMTFQQPLVLALDVIPGYLSKSGEFLFYGRAGIGAGWVKLGLTDTFGDQRIDTGANRVMFNYRLGFGMEYFMSKNYGLRIEYVYSLIRGDDDHRISDDEGKKTVHEIDREFIVTCPYSSTNAYKYLYGIKRAGIHTINLTLSIYPYN